MSWDVPEGYMLDNGEVTELPWIVEDAIVIHYDLMHFPKSDFNLLTDDQRKIALGWLAGQEGYEELKEMYASGLPIYEVKKDLSQGGAAR